MKVTDLSLLFDAL